MKETNTGFNQYRPLNYIAKYACKINDKAFFFVRTKKGADNCFPYEIRFDSVNVLSGQY